jgi:hypothetical protein
MAINRSRSTAGILSDLLTQFSTLVRQESELVRVEMSEKVSQIGTGLGLTIGGAVLVIPAIVILLQAAVQGLEQTGLASYWSSLAIGGGAVLIGLVLLMIGLSRLRADNLMPKKSIHQLQENIAMARKEARTTDDFQRAA